MCPFVYSVAWPWWTDGCVVFSSVRVTLSTLLQLPWPLLFFFFHFFSIKLNVKSGKIYKMVRIVLVTRVSDGGDRGRVGDRKMEEDEGRRG